MTYSWSREALEQGLMAMKHSEPSPLLLFRYLLLFRSLIILFKKMTFIPLQKICTEEPLLLGTKNIGHLLQHLDPILDPLEFLGSRLHHALIIIIIVIILVNYCLCLCLCLCLL
jgi:hypothetical protein